MTSAHKHIIFPLDVPTANLALSLARMLAGHVGMFKVGLELFISEGPDIVRRIMDETGAPVFLDLKLHDIPETVRRAAKQVSCLGVAMVTVHCGESAAMLRAAVDGAGPDIKVLGVTVLTSVSGNDIGDSGFEARFRDNPIELVVLRAEQAKKCGCAGVVCSGLEVARIKAAAGNDFLAITPGIRPESAQKKKDDQKRVTTPAGAIKNGADFLVIGRPIRDADNPVSAADRIAEEIMSAFSSY
ncbi:MAG: orotidine-5'-phosphate decarboxylase [Deltaproteobacteria bacterium]|nr:orotidine-5'-phosphate decarboxylase [Deltaproteobacteria bacterium]